jgi:hypothetical protein
VGYALPEGVAQMIRELRSRVPEVEEAVISFHGQNDLGLATANALAAVGAGARQVEVAVNGIGERAGNTSFEETVMALRVHGAALRRPNERRPERDLRALEDGRGTQRTPGRAQQGDRRPQCLPPRIGDPPGRGSETARDLRADRSEPDRPPHRKRDRPRQAVGARRLRRADSRNRNRSRG